MLKDELPVSARSLALDSDLESREWKLGPEQHNSCAFVWSALCLKIRNILTEPGFQDLEKRKDLATQGLSSCTAMSAWS